jgi:hypothetical protein
MQDDVTGVTTTSINRGGITEYRCGCIVSITPTGANQWNFWSKETYDADGGATPNGVPATLIVDYTPQAGPSSPAISKVVIVNYG